MIHTFDKLCSAFIKSSRNGFVIRAKKMSHKIMSFIILFFIAFGETINVEKNSKLGSNGQALITEDSVKSEGRNRMPNPEKLKKMVEDAFVKVAQAKQRQTFYCSETEYYDPVTTSCRKCDELCSDSSPKMCQVYCPWQYSYNQFDQQMRTSWIAFGCLLFFVLLTFLIILILYLKRNKHPSATRSASSLPGYYDPNDEKLPLTTGSEATLTSNSENKELKNDEENTKLSEPVEDDSSTPRPEKTKLPEQEQSRFASPSEFTTYTNQPSTSSVQPTTDKEETLTKSHA